MKVPSGERYELCRSVHAEMNAIISAARRDTLGATLYLAGREAKTGELLHDATSCSMCRRLIINAGHRAGGHPEHGDGVQPWSMWRTGSGSPPPPRQNTKPLFFSLEKKERTEKKKQPTHNHKYTTTPHPPGGEAARGGRQREGEPPPPPTLWGEGVGWSRGGEARGLGRRGDSLLLLWPEGG